jgi:hypothetical protein
MNVLNFTKTVANATKLERDLKSNATFGSLYNFLSVRGSELELNFKQNLNQTQIDAVSALINNYSDISVFDNLKTFLGTKIDPFVDNLLAEIRAQNMEMGVTQAGKTADVLGLFELPIILPGKTRAVTFKGSLDTGSLTVTMDIATYLIAHPELYSDLAPFITVERITEWRTKIYLYLTGG